MRGPYKTQTRENIMKAAWELFQEKGYENASISSIIERSNSSRSAFYHHFHSKEELLFSVAYTYDDDYDFWLHQFYREDKHTVDNLISYNTFVMKVVETSSYKSLYPHLYGLQVMTDGVRHILNPERRYYQILRELLKNGFEKGELNSPHSYAVLTDMITSFQIGIIYSWCLQKERYALIQYAQDLLNPFLNSLRAD
ncbi:MAG: TetR/AcrR family transcriptional regulator [Lachnospiraceae bacterium]|nr:TetR/AcrR family transcriptional regulator [Lachnospiraceae bacterium]